MVSTSPPPPPPSSPPPPPSPSPPSIPPPKHSLRNPLPPELLPPKRNRNPLEQIIDKRRLKESSQNKSLIHGLKLIPHVTNILQSNDLSSLQETFQNFIEFKNPLVITIFKSLALHYPNAFAFKLSKLLQQHPPVEIRNAVVANLVHIFTQADHMNLTVLNEIKKPLLDSLKKEDDFNLISPICETIGYVAARLYQYRRVTWLELLSYVSACFSCVTKLNHMKALLMIGELPVEVVYSREFWLDYGNFDVVYLNVLKFVNSPDRELQDLTYNASVTLIKMSSNLERTEVCDSLLTLLLCFIDLFYGEKEDLLNMVKQLDELVTLDIEGLFDGKERDVFWTMIRVMEIEDASDALIYIAVSVIKELTEAHYDAMKSVVQKFTHEEVERVFTVSINMMSKVRDDPVWYHIDNENCETAGFDESFDYGMFLLNLLSHCADERVFVHVALEVMALNCVSHFDWPVRHAAMLTITAIAENHFKGEMIMYIDQAVTLVYRSLKDQNHRVLWATMHAIKCLSQCKDMFNLRHYHLKFLVKLVPIIKDEHCVRVQVSAIIAIRTLVTNCGLEKILSCGGDIVVRMNQLLTEGKQKLREEALETLKSIEVQMPVDFFQHYYDATIEALKVILFENCSSPTPSLLLRAKCLELMGILVRKIGQDKIKKQEVSVLMKSLRSLERELSDTEHLARYIILKALDQFCRCSRVSIKKYINKIMPMLLKSAQLDLDLKASMPKDESLDDDKHLVESVRVQACNILSYCAVQSPTKISPNIVKVTDIFLRWLYCSSFETRKASTLAIPSLLLSIEESIKDQQNKRDAISRIVLGLVEAMRKETDSDLSKRMLTLLSNCIQTTSTYLNSEQIKIIAKEINRTLKQINNNEIERAHQAANSEGGIEFLPTKETIKDACFLIATAIDTFAIRFMIHIDPLMSTVAEFLRIDMPDRVIAFAISIFNILVQRFPNTLPQYHSKYIITALHALMKDYPHALLHATRAIGLCAKFGKDKFKTYTVSVCVSRLYDVMCKRLSVSGQSERDVMRSCDTAVAALGKICDYHRDCIDGRKVVQNWLNFLPLKHDLNEAKSTHGLLSRLIQRSDRDLFGNENENLPKIITVVKKILSRPQPDLLATENDINQMIIFMNQHGGME